MGTTDVRVDRAHERGDVVALCMLADAGSVQARELLYDWYEINDEDRAGIVAHQARMLRTGRVEV